MSENNLEGEQRERCKEAKFVDDNTAELIQRVTSVMAIADELHKNNIIHDEKYSEIRAANTNQEKMRSLFESLKSGGDKVKIVFHNLLEKNEPHLFKDLGGVSRKRKLADPESRNPVPCKRLNTESNEQNNPHFNSASPSAPRPAPINVVTNIVNERRPYENINNISILNKMERKPPAPKKQKKPPAPMKGKKPPAPKKVNKTPAPKNIKKTPAPKKVKKAPAPKNIKKTPAPKKVKAPAPKKVKKAPAPKKVKKAPAPKKVKKAPAPKKVKKAPAPKKVKKAPAPKKVKKAPAPKKVKKAPAPKKVKKAAARK